MDPEDPRFVRGSFLRNKKPSLLFAKAVFYCLPSFENKIIFRKNLTGISLTGNVIDVYLKDLDNNEVKRFKNDCNELFDEELVINVKSSI